MVLDTKPKVVVIMGATGSGKSRLAIDLAQVFRAEILNADSLQVVEVWMFSPTKFPLAIGKIIDGILSRNLLPIIFGGTNYYYIQGLLCPFLIDESAEEMDDLEHDVSFDFCTGIGGDDIYLSSCDIFRALDPVASNRIHPNDQRKINNYLRLYSGSGILPSKLLQGRASENWGRACNLWCDCCFLCIDASLPTLDPYLNERVDHMVRDGLLEEAYDVYNPKADYTRGLLQAIGVREFQDFLKFFLSKHVFLMAIAESDSSLKHKLKMALDVCDSELKDSLIEAIKRMKLNTRRLVRRQKRRLN